MSFAEMQRWAEFERESPFISHRVDVSAGIIASTLANVNRGKNQQPFEPIDFMPFLRVAHERSEVESRRIAMFPPPIDEDDATIQRMVAAYG